jgi:hypothetical protein
MRLFAVFCMIGDYEPPDLEGVFSTREKADAHIEKMKANPPADYLKADRYEIKELELDASLYPADTNSDTNLDGRKG